jgi:heme-degrading monooxygenase HmoA
MAMHVILWEFVVRPEAVADFVAACGTEGDWAVLFRRAEGYVGTELLRDEADGCRFVTIDRWRRAEDSARFQEAFAIEYRALDARLEGLTVRETRIGSFSEVRG